MTRGRINNLINLRKWIAIIWICFVEIGIINTHPPIFIGRLNEYNIGKPLGVLHLKNKSNS